MLDLLVVGSDFNVYEQKLPHGGLYSVVDHTGETVYCKDWNEVKGVIASREVVEHRQQSPSYVEKIHDPGTELEERIDAAVADAFLNVGRDSEKEGP